jgi:NAD(P)H-dependent flavin oxidoreductase YrpB (nitropropane dioxygenase family)
VTDPGAPSAHPVPGPPSAHPALRTPLCDLVGVRYPVVQTGMGWVAGPRLVAATAQAGALGILASATMTLEELGAAIKEVKSRTDEPFGVNLRTDATDVDAKVQLIVEEKVKVASFAQAPRLDVVRKLSESGVVVIPTVGARRHAEKVAEVGVPFVIAQGAEGGGHTGPVPTSLLVPDVVDAVGSSVAVIAAGGFSDGRGLVAALAWGASGIAMGTRFLLTAESTVPEDVKRMYLGTPLTGTVVTRSVDGAPQRVVRTPLVDHLERAGRLVALPRALRNALAFRRRAQVSMSDLVREGLAMKRSSELSWAQVVMAANAPMMTKAALVDGRTDVGVLPTGQVVGRIDELPTVRQVVDAVISEATSVLDRLCR